MLEVKLMLSFKVMVKEMCGAIGKSSQSSSRPMTCLDSCVEQLEG